MLAGVLGMSLASAIAQGAEITWRASNSQAPDHPLTIATHNFAEKVAELTDGRMEIKVFHSSHLSGNEIDHLKTGSLQSGIVTPSRLAQFDPSFAILEIPYLFRSYEHMIAVTRGPIGDRLAKDIEAESGLVLLGYFGGAARNMITVDHPIESIDDLEGMKMRTFQSDTMINWWADLGAIGAVVPFAEVYPALQTGVVDGGENEFSTFTTARWAEVAKDIAITEHNFTVRPMVASADAFYSLPEDIQAAVLEAAREAAEEDVALQRELDATNLARLEGEFSVTVSRPDKTPFIERSQATIQTFAESNDIEDLATEIIATGG
ncbi:TRAP transporter substrate-binding protein [Halovulum sp. GXIMD14794]